MPWPSGEKRRMERSLSEERTEVGTPRFLMRDRWRGEFESGLDSS